jgi:hypothetical protein
VVIGMGFYLAAALLSASVIAALRDDTRISGRAGYRSVLIVLVMFGLLGYGIYRFRFRPRAEAGQNGASALRLRHSPKDRFGLRDLPFAMLDRLTPPWTIANVMWGRWEGLEVTVFDAWSAGRQFGPPQQTEGPGHEYRCALIPFPTPWPTIVVEQERLSTRLADAVSVGDIAFESEQFNRAFEVRCSDARFAYVLLDGKMIAWLLALEREWGFEAMDGLLLGYTPIEGLAGPEAALTTVRGFLEHLPSVAYSLFPVSALPADAPPPAR